MPQPCVVSTTTVNLTANGAPAVLQADARLSSQPNKLIVASDGLRVPDLSARFQKTTPAGPLSGSTVYPIGFDFVPWASTGYAALGATNGVNTIWNPGAWLPGVWIIVAVIGLGEPFTSSGKFLSGLRLNGSSFIAPTELQGETAAAGTPIACSTLVWKFSATDYVEACLYHTDTVTHTVAGSNISSISFAYQGPGL